jgi:hypothetical protein
MSVADEAGMETAGALEIRLYCKKVLRHSQTILLDPES